ncbi:hypothetical protein KAR91_03110 [Candidatus Pacearchaeota archaeon]|nr:hypothetical protein [Candidatus Pacearchaeota archaeon]
MIYRMTIKHSKNDTLLGLIEHDVHKRIPGILSGILKDMMTDGLESWFQLEFFMEAHALDALCERLFWAEMQVGYTLDMPVSAEEAPNALL